MPNRILKESICTSDSVDMLNWFEEVVFYRLIVNCDDYGRFDGRMAIIKNRLFPLKETVTAKSIEAAINKLATVGLVALYTVDGRPYLQLPTWERHQSIRAKSSKYPACEQTQADESICKQEQADVPVFVFENPIRESESECENAREARHAHGQYGWVKLTDAQYAKLKADLGEAEVERCIAYIDESAQSTGNKNKWKDWNLTVRKCSRDGWGLGKRPMSAAEYSARPQKAIDMDELIKAVNKI